MLTSNLSQEEIKEQLKNRKLQILHLSKTKSKFIKTKIEILKDVETKQIFVGWHSKKLMNRKTREIVEFRQLFSLETFFTLYDTSNVVLKENHVKNIIQDYIDNNPMHLETSLTQINYKE